jgi:hypothetical protein
MGGGGFGFVRASLSNECVLVGLRLLLRAEIEGGKGADPGGNGGGATPGRGGGRPFGIDGALDTGAETFLEFVSGSESYMFTPPPVFLSFGIPAANSPPNCGAASIPPPPPAAAFPGWSLLLLALFPPAVDGRSPPGTGGAPPMGGPPESFGLSMIGADRSFTTPTFLSLAPFVMSPSKAPYVALYQQTSYRLINYSCGTYSSLSLFRSRSRRYISGRRRWRRRRALKLVSHSIDYAIFNALYLPPAIPGGIGGGGGGGGGIFAAISKREDGCSKCFSICANGMRD